MASRARVKVVARYTDIADAWQSNRVVTIVTNHTAMVNTLLTPGDLLLKRNDSNLELSYC
jgi:hypothetical protein